MGAEERLIEWAKEKFYPGWAEPSPSAVLGRMMDEGRDSRRKTQRQRMLKLLQRALDRFRVGRSNPVPCKESRGVRMEVVVLDGESTVCPPDGGIGRMIERMAASIERSHRCREVGETLDLMPRDLFLVVHHTYGNCATPREIPRQARAAWESIGVSKATYFRRKREMLAWLGERLGIPVPSLDVAA
jgi:hypothetical protein